MKRIARLISTCSQAKQRALTVRKLHISLRPKKVPSGVALQDTKTARNHLITGAQYAHDMSGE